MYDAGGSFRLRPLGLTRSAPRLAFRQICLAVLQWLKAWQAEHERVPSILRSRKRLQQTQVHDYEHGKHDIKWCEGVHIFLLSWERRLPRLD